jgi:hypothetical protein
MWPTRQSNGPTDINVCFQCMHHEYIGGITMSEKIDLSYRPETYWPESLNQEQLLAEIQGESRRAIARKILAEDGFAGLNAFFARKALDEGERRYWGSLHPRYLGGEYLPRPQLGELEIARISLAEVACRWAEEKNRDGAGEDEDDADTRVASALLVKGSNRISSRKSVRPWYLPIPCYKISDSKMR